MSVSKVDEIGMSIGGFVFKVLVNQCFKKGVFLTQSKETQYTFKYPNNFIV